MEECRAVRGLGRSCDRGRAIRRRNLGGNERILLLVYTKIAAFHGLVENYDKLVQIARAELSIRPETLFLSMRSIQLLQRLAGSVALSEKLELGLCTGRK